VKRKNQTGRMACVRKNTKACRVLVEKPETRTPLERQRIRRGDNTKVNRKYVGWETVEWIQLAPNRTIGGSL